MNGLMRMEIVDPDLHVVRKGYKGSLRERLERKIERIPFHSCWEWTGAIGAEGYGRLWGGVQQMVAHRVSYMVYVGPIPQGLQLDHLCRNRACVNPKHLEPVTQRENALRGISTAAIFAKRSCCLRGHEFTPENTRHRPDRTTQGRICVACSNLRARRRRLRAKA